jgi:hypothetical protein
MREKQITHVDRLLHRKMLDEQLPPSRLDDDGAKLLEHLRRGRIPVKRRVVLVGNAVKVDRVSPNEPSSAGLVGELCVLGDGLGEAGDELVGEIGGERAGENDLATERVLGLLKEERFVGEVASRSQFREVQNLREREHLQRK